MQKPKVTIIDYGVGNLLSVKRALEECGAETFVSNDFDFIARSDKVILPGVGAFAKGMSALKSLNLVEVIKKITADGVPLMGICLGMQLLLEESEEHGLTKGLGIIPGRVVPVPTLSIDSIYMKVPHIGWNSLIVAEDATWDRTILENLTLKNTVYFVHSFMSVPEDQKMRLADCLYGGNRIPAVIKKQNIFGCQFHPEKSGVDGLKILKNFIHL